MRFRLSFFLTIISFLLTIGWLSDVLSDKTFKTYFLQNLIYCVGLKSRYYLFHIHNIVKYIYNNQHILIQRSVKFFINFVRYKGDIRDVREYKKPFKRHNIN